MHWKFVARRAAMPTLATAVLLLPATAQAQYLDPGSGSIIVQAVVATVVASAAVIKLYWWKISKLFSRRRDDDKQP
jgi:hypothetical protein